MRRLALLFVLAAIPACSGTLAQQRASAPSCEGNRTAIVTNGSADDVEVWISQAGRRTMLGMVNARGRGEFTLPPNSSIGTAYPRRPGTANTPRTDPAVVTIRYQCQ